MRYVCLFGCGVGLTLVFAFPCPRAPGIVGVLLFLGFALALIALFAGFLARVIGARRSRIKWSLVAVVVLLPAAVFGLRGLNAPRAETQIERTIQAVATSGDPAYCGTKVTLAFEKLDRRRFNRAYRGLLLASGASPGAAACALRKTGALSNPELEHVLLHEESQVFVPIGVACDRRGTERRTVQALANPRTGFPPAVVECAAAKLRSSSNAELVRLQQSLIAYNELMLSCNPEALVDFQQRQLSRNDTLNAETVACALAVFRRLPPVKAIRLTYDEVSYERLIERCKR